MTIQWHEVGADVYHAFDAHGFCACVFKGKALRGKPAPWFPRTRDSEGHVAPLCPAKTLDEAKAAVEAYRRGLA